MQPISLTALRRLGPAVCLCLLCYVTLGVYTPPELLLASLELPLPGRLVRAGQVVHVAGDLLDESLVAAITSKVDSTPVSTRIFHADIENWVKGYQSTYSTMNKQIKIIK